MLTKVRVIATGIAMSVLLAAGLLKASTLGDFALSLGRWRIIPSVAPIPLSLVIVGAEIACGCSWFLGTRRRVAVIVATALLVMFSAALATEYALAKMPDCYCFGRWLEYNTKRSGLQAAMLRNGILVATLLQSLLPGGGMRGGS
ncbi:MAG: hypothetical protein IPJ41_12775 [Phycisphaerales bacterium]|nr:hypothetical protein [Phycisphaerales bacterium]